MSSRTVDDVLNALEQFKDVLAPEPLREKIRLTKQYELFEGSHGKADWPTSYGKIWGAEGDTGVYLHFDAENLLTYVGKAVSIGTRLGSYFGYGEIDKCRIKDEALKDSVRLRAVILDGDPLKFLTPSLEWFLIERLNPPVNILHKRRDAV